MDAINKGLPVDSGDNPYDSKIEDSAETSSKTGVMLALFAAGLLVGSPIFGYLGIYIYIKFGRQPIVS